MVERDGKPVRRVGPLVLGPRGLGRRWERRHRWRPRWPSGERRRRCGCGVALDLGLRAGRRLRHAGLPSARVAGGARVGGDAQEVAREEVLLELVLGLVGFPGFEVPVGPLDLAQHLPLRARQFVEVGGRLALLLQRAGHVRAKRVEPVVVHGRGAEHWGRRRRPAGAAGGVNRGGGSGRRCRRRGHHRHGRRGLGLVRRRIVAVAGVHVHERPARLAHWLHKAGTLCASGLNERHGLLVPAQLARRGAGGRRRPMSREQGRVRLRGGLERLEQAVVVRFEGD